MPQRLGITSGAVLVTPFKAEARFCMHRGVSGHSYFGGCTGGRDNIIVSHEMKLMTVDAGLGRIDFNVVSILHFS